MSMTAEVVYDATGLVYAAADTVRTRGVPEYTMDDLRMNAERGDQLLVPFMLEHSRWSANQIGRVTRFYQDSEGNLLADFELDVDKYPLARTIVDEWQRGRMLGLSVGVHRYTMLEDGRVFGHRIQEVSAVQTPYFERARILSFRRRGERAHPSPEMGLLFSKYARLHLQRAARADDLFNQ
jgi:hypothetical protein